MRSFENLDRVFNRRRASTPVDNHVEGIKRLARPPVSLELRGFLEIALGELWLDLRVRSRRSAEQQEQE